MPAYRNSASFGKRQEFIVFGELLRRGFDVYLTLVDDQQIDCIIRFDKEPPVYIDIQIKARSITAKYPGTFSALTLKKPRETLFYIFYSEGANCYWVMPSLDVAKYAHRNKAGKTRENITLCLLTRTPKAKSGHDQNGENTAINLTYYKDS